jgi:LmbE family N-acetylglucosaminyl deacetylase
MPTLLAIIPHPDDEAYSFGGTIALAARAGWRCIVHCASAGEGGKRHDSGPAGPMALAAARTSELRNSCRLLGARLPTIWGLPDGELADLASEAPRIQGLFGALKPDVALALGPDGAYGHPDHIAVSAAEAWDDASSRTRRSPPSRRVCSPQYEKCLDAGDAGALREAIGPARSTTRSTSRAWETAGGNRGAPHATPGGTCAPFPKDRGRCSVERFVDASGRAWRRRRCNAYSRSSANRKSSRRARNDPSRPRERGAKYAKPIAHDA